MKSIPSSLNHMPSSPPGRGIYTESARLERIAFVRNQTNAKLEHVNKTSLKAESLTNTIESYLGSIEIPVGVAGPLKVNGSYANGVYYAPFATTEGALIASINRGAYAVSLSGGVTTHVLGQRMMRVPLFICDNILMSERFARWVTQNFQCIRQETLKHSNYAELVELTPQIFGSTVHVHFIYQTGDAAGQNMSTVCTWEACKWIMQSLQDHQEIRLQRFYIEGGLSSDKKVSNLNANQGRGINVQAEAVIPEKILKRVLKTTPEQFMELWTQYSAAYMATGGNGINVNVANVIAAIFTATGQDIGCVHESAVANSSVHLTESGSLYWCISLPSLVIGTVGGGTALKHQQECLEMLGCNGNGKVFKLAELIAGYCLSLDLSTCCAIAAGHFATAHEKLGRNRLLDSVKLGDFNTEFFTPYLIRYFDEPGLSVEKAYLDESFELQGSIVTEVTSRKLKKTIGLFPYQLQFQRDCGLQSLDVMLKVKPTDDEVAGAAYQLAALCDEALFNQFKQHKKAYGIEGCDQRELEIYQLPSKTLQAYMPKIYGLYQDPDREAFVIIQERLCDMAIMDSANDLSVWQDHHIKAALTGLAHCHSVYYQNTETLSCKAWMKNQPDMASRVALSGFYTALINHAEHEFDSFINSEQADRLRMIVHHIPLWWQEMETLPKTLVHNDFNPRNIGLRNTANGLMLCAYDWELAAIHIPQVDVADFLAYVLNGKATEKNLCLYVDFYRTQLESHLKQTLAPIQFWRGFSMALMDFAVTRLPLYLLTHTFRQSDYVPTVYKTVNDILDTVLPLFEFPKPEPLTITDANRSAPNVDAVQRLSNQYD